jgi:hypothetical protein
VRGGASRAGICRPGTMSGLEIGSGMGPRSGRAGLLRHSVCRHGMWRSRSEVRRGLGAGGRAIAGGQAARGQTNSRHHTQQDLARFMARESQIAPLLSLGQAVSQEERREAMCAVSTRQQ